MVESIYRQELARISWSTPDTSTCHANQLRDKPSHKSSKHSSGTNHSGSNNNNNNSEAILRGRKPQTDEKNLTQDLVARIYQEELMKLAVAAKSSGNLDELNVYRQELDRLALTAQQRTRLENADEHPNQAPEKDCPGRILNGKIDMRVKSEVFLSESQSSLDDELSDRSAVDSFGTFDFPQDLRIKKENVGPDLLRHTGSAFTLVRPRSARLSSNSSPPPPSTPAAASSAQAPYSSPLASTDDLSPLQQMQSIANSLLTKTQRPLRAVLPPITQQQIEKYTTVNTDDLVRKIKDMLSQFSISQRLFGENVLGLSQGSVSDLLARPKPWHMLTQKGREPFIRMQVFLEDEESITKLVATQYQIPADKFLRSNSAYSDCMTPGLHSLKIQLKVSKLKPKPCPHIDGACM